MKKTVFDDMEEFLDYCKLKKDRNVSNSAKGNYKRSERLMRIDEVGDYWDKKVRRKKGYQNKVKFVL